MGCCSTRDNRKFDQEYKTNSRINSRMETSLEVISPELSPNGVSNTKEFEFLLEKLISNYNTEIQSFTLINYSPEYILNLLNSLMSLEENELELKIILLHSIVKEKREEVLEVLRENRGLKILMRWITCSNEVIRTRCAEICHLMYRNSLKTKKIFLRNNGHIMLLQLISLSSNSEQALSDCLKFIKDLIEGDKNYAKIACFRLHQSMVWRVFHEVNPNLISEQTVLDLELLKAKIIKHVMKIKNKNKI